MARCDLRVHVSRDDILPRTNRRVHAHHLLPRELRWVSHTGSAALEITLRREEMIIEFPSGHVLAKQPAARQRIEWRDVYRIHSSRGAPTLVGEIHPCTRGFIQQPPQRRLRRAVIVKAATDIGMRSAKPDLLDRLWAARRWFIESRRIGIDAAPARGEKPRSL